MTPADALRATVDVARAELDRRSEPAVSDKPGPERWCQKEILGHLIDSAANNHQRLVRAQLAETLEFPSYQQTGWVERQGLRRVQLARAGRLLDGVQPASGDGHRAYLGARPRLLLPHRRRGDDDTRPAYRRLSRPSPPPPPTARHRDELVTGRHRAPVSVPPPETRSARCRNDGHRLSDGIVGPRGGSGFSRDSSHCGHGCSRRQRPRVSSGGTETGDPQRPNVPRGGAPHAADTPICATGGDTHRPEVEWARSPLPVVALSVGDRLGHYDVTALVGEGDGTAIGRTLVRLRPALR